MTGITGEVPQEDTGEGRWLSYAELAEIRGIGRESAVKLAQRERWPRRPGNDRTARVLVPLEYLKSAKASPGERSPEHTGELSHTISGLEDVVAFARERVEAAERRAEAAEARAGRAEQALATERSRADAVEADRRAAEARAERAEQAVAGAQARADVLRERVDELEGELAEKGIEAMQAQAGARKAEEAAEALRQADVTRRARGRLRRAWDGWRGL